MIRISICVLLAIAAVAAKQQIVIAPGTQFRDWDERLVMPGYRFNCSRTAALFDCVVSSHPLGPTQDADIVVFQADELQRKKIQQLPRKHSHQMFVAYSLESPWPYLPYLASMGEYRGGKFDYLALVAPYPQEAYPELVPAMQKTLRLMFGHPHPSEFPPGPDRSPEFVRHKMRLLQDRSTPWITVMIHNDEPWRVNLLRATMEAFDGKVRSMGPVLNNYRLPAHQTRFVNNWNEAKRNVIKDYLFHFAWENSWEPGFITEKIFDCFVAGTVPIYLGTEDIYELVPCDMSAHPCFIDYSHFQRNPLLLRAYIQHLVSHPEEYMRYFEWLDHPISPKYARLHRQYIEHGAFCRLCDAYYVEKNLSLV